jgi:hypothetical protein
VKASRVLPLTIFLLLLSAARAEGCTCGVESPADAFDGATAVFVGRVVRTAEHEADKVSEAGQTAVALVEESFKGARVGREIVFEQPNSTCTPTFDAGERLLFYANYAKKTKTWTVYGCGRTSNLERAADDLLYLRALPLSAERNRVSGMLEHYEDGPDRGFKLVERLAGVKVRVKGKDKTYEAMTDSNGVYELYDLPPGKYTIEPELPFGLKIRFPMQFGPGVYSPGGEGPVTVELTEKTCAGADFILNSDNSIGGRVLGPGGVPLPGVCVELLTAAKAESDPYGRIFGCADADGRYKLGQVPPGRYLVVANAGGWVTGDTPFRTAYYPGTFERERASVLTIGRGDSRTDLDIAVPELFPTVSLSGVLVYSDGRPAAGMSVSFIAAPPDTRRPASSSARADEAGRFSLKAIRGVPGYLQANFYAYEGAFEKTCPAVKSLIEKGDGRAVTVETPPVVVSAADDTSDLRVVFPVPFCAPKKRENDRQEEK